MIRTALEFLLALSAVAPSAWAGQFKHVTYYKAGGLPSQIVTADFNNDGNLDLAMADWLSNQVVVLLGNGDGTFQKPITFSVPSPTDLAAADLDGDGNIDLAITESGGSGPGVLAIYLGNGNGRFSLKSKYKLGDYTGVVKIADFNQDGIPDIATGDEGTGSSGVVRIFMGMGKAKFHKPVAYQIGEWLNQIEAGDVNGDHYPDIAVAESMVGKVAVLTNNGKGRFGKPVSYDAGGGEVVDVKVADLRNNGDQDLVVANGSLSAVGVLLNNGDGTFGKVTLYPTHSAVEAVVVADFNLDGHLDAAVVAHIDNSALIYGNGDGSFGAPVAIVDTGKDHNGGYDLAAGDFNSDSAPDLAIPIELDGKVAIMLNAK